MPDSTNNSRYSRDLNTDGLDAEQICMAAGLTWSRITSVLYRIGGDTWGVYISAVNNDAVAIGESGAGCPEKDAITLRENWSLVSAAQAVIDAAGKEEADAPE